MAEKMLIVGAGHLGTAWARRWRAVHPEGDLVATVTSEESRGRLAGTGARLEILDLLRPFEAKGFLDGADRLLCCVAPGRDGDAALWGEGVPRLAAALPDPGRTHVVHISSTGVYREEAGGVVDENSPAGGTDRSDALLAAERAFAGGSATILRCSGLVDAGRGPHRILDRLAGRERPGGDGWLNLVWIDDVLEAIERAFARRLQGVWNLSSPARPRREFYAPLLERAGLEPIRWVDSPPDPGRRVDASRFARDFGFEPRPVRPEDLQV